MAAQFEIVGKLTSMALETIARNFSTGYSFTVDEFVMGTGGHDPSNVALAFAPDPALGDICTGDDCPSIVITTQAVSEVVFATPTCPVFKCELALGSYVGYVSQLLLIATIISDDGTNGDKFVFAVANMPRKTMLITDAAVFQVGVRLGG